MRPPTRSQWPKGLRDAARQRRGLYGKLDTLRVLSPECLCFLIEHWDSPRGKRLLDEIDNHDYWAFEQLLKSGQSAMHRQSTRRRHRGRSAVARGNK